MFSAQSPKPADKFARSIMSAPRARLVADVLETEAAAIMTVAGDDRLLTAVDAAAELIATSRDTLIVAGVGKSGHVARKLVASFASLGKRSAFLHPAEASHGDLGMIGEESVLLVLSNSGETRELSDLLAFAEMNGNPVIGLTASATSTLGRASRIVLAHGRHREACRNGLAPTTSTTLAIAIGDALAVAVSDIIGFRPEDFHRFHPGGRLGTALSKAGTLMVPIEDCPSIAWDAPAIEAALALAIENTGFLVIRASLRSKIIGVLTGDILRRDPAGLASCSVAEIAALEPVLVSVDETAQSARNLMLAAGVHACLVHDAAGTPIGVLRIADCG